MKLLCFSLVASLLLFSGSNANVHGHSTSPSTTSTMYFTTTSSQIPSASSSSSFVLSPSLTPSAAPSVSATSTPMPSASPSSSALPSTSATSTPVPSPSSFSTATPSVSATSTPIPSLSSSQSTSPSASASSSPVPAAAFLPPGLLPLWKRDELHRRILAAGGCNVNVCFAIDGSGSISNQEFTNQKNFVLDVASIIGVDGPVEFSDVQSATSISAISPATLNTTKFIVKVNGAFPGRRHSPGRFQRGGRSFIASGINYCFARLARRQGEVMKIILLGDGHSNIGAGAIRRADLFRRYGGSLSVVGAGFADENILLMIAGGRHENVFSVDSFLDSLQLQVIIEELVQDICKNAPSSL